MKNCADALIFHTSICAENVTNTSLSDKRNCTADFSCGSSNENVLGMEDYYGFKRNVTIRNKSVCDS